MRRRGVRNGSELRLLGGPRLLRFAREQTTSSADMVSCAYPIAGGLLARRPGGELSLSQSRGEPTVLRAAIRGFTPRWRGPLYELVQRRAHVAISRRYFRSLVEETR